MRADRRARPAARLLAAAALLATLAGPLDAGERWGWLGVRIRDLTEQEMEELSAKVGLGEGFGALVAEVIEDTPAESAGLRDGDLIVAIDGRPIVETRALQRLVGSTEAGREIELVVLRDGRRQELRARVGEMPAELVAERVAFEFGFLVRGGARDAPDPPGGGPPVVAAVADGSSAARAGLQAGDRIVAVNGRDVPSLETFRRRAQDILLRDELRLRVERRGETLDLTLPPVQRHGRR